MSPLDEDEDEDSESDEHDVMVLDSSYKPSKCSFFNSNFILMKVI